MDSKTTAALPSNDLQAAAGVSATRQMSHINWVRGMTGHCSFQSLLRAEQVTPPAAKVKINSYAFSVRLLKRVERSKIIVMNKMLTIIE